MMKETLAQAAARLDEELDNMAGDVYTFSALLPASIDYLIIRDIVYSTVEGKGLHVGDLAWSVQDELSTPVDKTAKILVGIGKTAGAYHTYYNIMGQRP